MEVYAHMADYDPYYSGRIILGTVYFKNCILTAYTRMRRAQKKNNPVIYSDDLDATLELNGIGTEDRAIEHLLYDDLMETHAQMQRKYSSEQYARKQTRKWAQGQGIELSDIFS